MTLEIWGAIFLVCSGFWAIDKIITTKLQDRIDHWLSGIDYCASCDDWHVDGHHTKETP